MTDNVNHPEHYTKHPSGVECIQIAEHFGFCLGNAIKYIWRAELKNGLEDLKKAAWYLQREIQKREGSVAKPYCAVCARPIEPWEEIYYAKDGEVICSPACEEHRKNRDKLRAEMEFPYRNSVEERSLADRVCEEAEKQAAASAEDSIKHFRLNFEQQKKLDDMLNHASLENF